MSLQVVAACRVPGVEPEHQVDHEDLAVATLEVEDPVVPDRLDAVHGQPVGRWSSSHRHRYSPTVPGRRGGSTTASPRLCARTRWWPPPSRRRTRPARCVVVAGEDVLGAGHRGHVPVEHADLDVGEEELDVRRVRHDQRPRPVDRPVPRTGSAPGWTQSVSGSSSHRSLHGVEVGGLERLVERGVRPPRPRARLLRGSATRGPAPRPSGAPPAPRRAWPRTGGCGCTRPRPRRPAPTWPSWRPRAARAGAARRPRRPAARPRNRLRLVATSTGWPSSCSRSVPAEHVPVLVGGLGEPDARVDRDPLRVDAGRRAPRRAARAARSTTSATTSPYVGVPLHLLGVRPPVHQHVGDAEPGDRRQHLVVGQPAGDVVDQHRAGRDGRRRDRGAHGVHRDHARPRRPAPRTTGSTRSSSSGELGRAAPGPGRLAADVDEVGALARPAGARARAASAGSR